MRPPHSGFVQASISEEICDSAPTSSSQMTGYPEIDPLPIFAAMRFGSAERRGEISYIFNVTSGLVAGILFHDFVIFGRRLEQPPAAAWTWVLRFAGEPKWAIGGKMGLQTCLPASRISRFSRLLLGAPHFFSVFSVFASRLARVARVGLALALLLLLPMEQGELFAQQATYYGQYAPYQQPQSYGQPSYAQQPYTSYPQQAYPSSGRDYPASGETYPASSQAYPQQAYGQAQPLAQPLNAQQLEQLVAPIALYPDNLVAQMLTASTYPLQVVDADRWRQAQGSAYSEQIAAGADAQSWDPSVKAMTGFPQVLAEMDRNLQWTTELGNAYYNQPQATFAAVQVMRQRAQAAGNLQNTAQEAVSYDQGNILLGPDESADGVCSGL
jgi:Protein of unknown function (DUF3300)